MQKGSKHSPETIAKFKATRAVISDETREKLRKGSLGHKWSDEQRAKYRASRKGVSFKKGVKNEMSTETDSD